MTGFKQGTGSSLQAVRSWESKQPGLSTVNSSVKCPNVAIPSCLRVPAMEWMTCCFSGPARYLMISAVLPLRC